MLYMRHSNTRGISYYHMYLGCSISRFSNGDISIDTGPTLVKHGGGVTNHDSSMELGRMEWGDRLRRPSCDPAPEWFRL